MTAQNMLHNRDEELDSDSDSFICFYIVILLTKHKHLYIKLKERDFHWDFIVESTLTTLEYFV